MRRRANLLIFVFVSLALEHRESIDGLGIAMYAAQRAERGRDGALVTGRLDRIATGRPARRNDT
jgi:hypothetical protein